MSNSLHSFSKVRITFDPYNHEQVQTLLKKVNKDFGRDKTRWCYRSPDIGDLDNNVWILDFYFRDPHDATMFGLKYI